MLRSMQVRRGMPVDDHGIDDPPPFLGKWSRVYTAVLVYLFGLIAVLYFLTRLFTY
jgi:hypothetical protein